VTADPTTGASALGAYIKLQRRLANLSLRQLADLSEVSNPYLSQVERGLHEPSVRVLRSIARALSMSAESLLGQAGLLDESEETSTTGVTEAAIRSDLELTLPQKEALLSVYRSYISANEQNRDD
jgi:transcriptional regulator with XRE-family HTH domain